jgi:hypothetical protein
MAWENARESALENSALDRPAAVEGGLNRIIINTFSQHLNDPIAFTEEGVARLRRVERDIQNSIESAYAQRNDTDNEIANALQDFLIDVRGIRSSVERRLSANEAGQRRRAPAVQEVAPTPQGRPIPDLSADDLLAGYGEQMTREQRDWLGSFVRNWESNVDDSPAGGELADRMSRMYQQWRQENTLLPDPVDNLFDDIGNFEPDPTAVANRGAGLPAPVEVSPARQNELYRNYIDNLDIDTEDLTVQDLAELIRGNDTVGTQNTTQAERDILASLVEEYGLRDNFNPAGAEAAPARQAQLPAPVEPQQALQPMRAEPIPRHIRDIGAFTNMSPAWNRQAQELADTYFNDNVIDGTNVTIGALTNMLRNYRVGPHADSPNEVRELAARMLEGRHAEAEGSAEQVADALNEAMYMDMDPPDAVDAIVRDITALERDGENFWEDLAGPLAEDIPWSRNLQHHLIGYLRELANRYGDMWEEGYAKGGRVNKKRKVKKDEMLLFLTRKSPELAEMAYRYGGMI